MDGQPTRESSLLDTSTPDAQRGAGARSPLFWRALLVAMVLTWGFSFCIMKGALDALPPSLLLSCRFIIASAIMFAIYRKSICTHLDRRYIVAGVLVGASLWAAYTLQTIGLTDTTPGKNAFLTGTYCVLVPFIGRVVTRERLTVYNVGAAFICLAGIALVALDSLAVSFGDALTLAGAVFFALEIVLAAKYGRDLEVGAMTFWMFATVSVLCVIASFATEQMPPASTWNAEVIGTVAFLAVICTCVGMLVQNLGLAHVPAATGSLLLSLESHSGVLFSVLLAGELLSLRLIVGFALIFVAIVLSETHFAFLRKRPRSAERSAR